MNDNSYEREVLDEDGDRFQVRVPAYVNEGKIRVITDPDCGRPVWLTLKQAREAHEALGEAIHAAEAMLAEPETAAAGLPRLPRDTGALFNPGDRIRVRRYIVSSLGGSHEGLIPEHDYTGIIRATGGGRVSMNEAAGGYFCPDDVFLGGDPAVGTSRWLETDVQLIKRKAA